MSYPEMLTLSAILFILYLFLRFSASRRTSGGGGVPLPPGPKPRPLVGNLFDIPTTREYETYAQWGRKYGKVIHLTALGNHIVVLNSFDAAKELLDVRSAKYSDRPFIPMLHDPQLMDGDWCFIFQRYSEQWRRQRRLSVRHLAAVASRAFQERGKSPAHTLLRLLLQAPQDFSAHLRHVAAETVLSIAYGYQVRDKDDPIVMHAEYASKILGEGVLPTRFLVNVFPALKYLPAWFPGAGFVSFAAECRAASQKAIEVPFEYAKRRLENGTATPSLVTSALSDSSPDHTIADIKAVAATMYGAAADTTAASMQYCILALVLHPAVQTRAQAELDRVLGAAASPAARLPTPADRAALPYIGALVQEVLRWHPAVPLGVPHATSADDVYDGARIPRGAAVVANAWAMLRDADTYADPRAFRPERFLGAHPEPHPATRGCFGFGRRECPGRHLAEASLWIQVASLLAAFTFSPAKDAHGRDIDVSYACEPSSGLILHPQNFPCTITPRSKEAEVRILETRFE